MLQCSDLNADAYGTYVPLHVDLLYLQDKRPCIALPLVRINVCELHIPISG